MIFNKFIIYFITFVFYFDGESSAKDYCDVGSGVSVLECYVPIVIDGKKLEVDSRYLPGMSLYSFPPDNIQEMIIVGYSKYFLPRDVLNKDDFYPFGMGEVITVSVVGWEMYGVSELLSLEEFKRINRYSLGEADGYGYYNGIIYEKYRGGKGEVAFFYDNQSFDMCYNIFSDLVEYCSSFFDLDGFQFNARYSLKMIESKNFFISEFLKKWSDFSVDEFSSR